MQPHNIPGAAPAIYRTIRFPSPPAGCETQTGARKDCAAVLIAHLIMALATRHLRYLLVDTARAS
ncbi:MAG: hypothetical protein HXY39_08690 [Chloroflexi bacterium]|nr:hypothetical protein [Chloroflexota bacterium]